MRDDEHLECYVVAYTARGFVLCWTWSQTLWYLCEVFSKIFRFFIQVRDLNAQSLIDPFLSE